MNKLAPTHIKDINKQCEFMYQENSINFVYIFKYYSSIKTAQQKNK